MRKTLLLVALTLLMLGCSSNQAIERSTESAWRVWLRGEEDLHVVQEEEFLDSLRGILEAHDDCEFPTQIRRRIPNGIRGSGSWQLNPSTDCLGRVTVTDLSVESPSIVAVKLLPAGKDPSIDQELVLFASFVDDAWMFSWPVAIGAPLHGR